MYYSINECYRFHYYGNTVFCYCPGETSIYLNRAQILVLKYCDGSNTIDEIYSKVSNELKITDTNLIKNKIDNLLDDLRLMKIINMKTESSKTSINYTGEYGLKYPKALVLELTSFCNFDCLHCFHGSNKKQKYFSLEFAKILSTKYKNKISTIDVTGGEATLHQDFEKICNLLQQSFEVNLLTNGSMLHNINVDVLKHFHDIQVSLYGYNYDTFLSFTKNSSAYNQVTEGINYLKNNKIPYTSVVCITQHNLNQLNDYVKFAIKSGSKKMKFTLSFPVGNVNKDNYYSEFQITGSYYESVIKEVQRLKEYYKNDIEIIVPINKYVRKNSSLLSCMGGKTSIVVNANGGIRACHLFKGESKINIIEYLENVEKRIDYNFMADAHMFLEKLNDAGFSQSDINCVGFCE
ncbi:MAG: radical SAM protein [Erysipelotrichales bacterium]|nr:radical SAM protein [Erysipelotrichales bacterium]